MRRLLFPVLFAAAIAPCYAAPAIDVLLPPGATAVFGLRTTTLLRLLSQQEGAKDLQKQVSAMLAATPWAGFDPFHDIDELVIAAMPGKQNPPVLALVTGRFDAAKLTQGKGRPYRGATLLEDAKSGSVLAVLDGSYILAGDPALVRAALDRSAAAPQSNGTGAIAARIESLRSRYDVWAFADRLDLTSLPAGFSAMPLKGLDRIWFGAAFSRQFDLSAELHFRDAKDVKAAVDMLHDLEKQAKEQMHGAAEIELSSTSDSVTLAVSIPEQEWKRALVEQFHPTSKPKAEPPPKQQVITTDTTGSTVTLSLPGKRP